MTVLLTHHTHTSTAVVSKPGVGVGPRAQRNKDIGIFLGIVLINIHKRPVEFKERSHAFARWRQRHTMDRYSVFYRMAGTCSR